MNVHVAAHTTEKPDRQRAIRFRYKVQLITSSLFFWVETVKNSLFDVQWIFYPELRHPYCLFTLIAVLFVLSM